MATTTGIVKLPSSRQSLWAITRADPNIAIVSADQIVIAITAATTETTKNNFQRMSMICLALAG